MSSPATGMTALGFDIGLTNELAARNSAHRQTAHACARAAAVPRNRYFEHVVNTTAFITAPLSPGLTTQGIALELLSGYMSDIYTVDSVDDALSDVGRMVADTFDSLRRRQVVQSN